MCSCDGGAVVVVEGVCVAVIVVRWLWWRVCVWLQWWRSGCGGEGVCGCDGGAVAVVEGGVAVMVVRWLWWRGCVFGCMVAGGYRVNPAAV